MKYKVTAGTTPFECRVDGDQVTVDGKVIRCTVERVGGTPVVVVSVGDAVHRLVVRPGATRGAYDVSLEGFILSVEALDERAVAIRALTPAAPRQGTGRLIAPMPGLIVKIGVAEGDAVHAGQRVVTMEAMKMENELRATADGTVKRVLVAPGAVVEKGAVLLEIE